MNYKEFVDAWENNTISVGVDLAFARKFFTTMSFKKTGLIVGKQIIFKKTVVMLLFYLSPILMLTSVVFSFIFFNFYGLAALLFPIIHFKYNGISSMANKSVKLILMTTIAAIATYILNEFHIEIPISIRDPKAAKIMIIAILFLSSLLCSRLIYRSSGYFIRSLIIQHEQFFLYMKDKIIIEYAPTGASN